MHTPSATGEPPDAALGARVDTSPSGYDDRALLRAMAAGDERALATLYDRWAPVVQSLVQRILRDPEETADVVEEAFWQTWRQAERYEPARGTPVTWLLTIARSRALDRLRALRRQRDDVTAEPQALGEIAASTPDPSAATEASEQRSLVAAALQELPREQRETLELAYFDGLSQSEIAERTAQPLGTVKTRMRLAMQKLRERLSVLGPIAP